LTIFDVKSNPKIYTFIETKKNVFWQQMYSVSVKGL
jgi:hypothetical protein